MDVSPGPAGFLIRNLFAFLVAALGLLSLVGTYISRTHRNHGLFAAQLPFTRLSLLISLVLGFTLLYFAAQLRQGKRRALYISVAVTATLASLSLLHSHTPLRSLPYIIIALILWSSRRHFTVKSDNYSLRRGILAATALLVASLAYATFGFYFLEKREFGIDFTLWQSFKYALIQIFTFKDQVLPPATLHAQFFLRSIDAVSFAAAGLAVSSLFKPVRFFIGVSETDLLTAKNIIANHGHSSEDFFKLWPRDKHYFFNDTKTSVLAYKVSRGCALILDGPNGAAQTYKSLVNDFVRFARENGWEPAIIHGDQSLEGKLDDDFKRVFIGREAVIKIDDFVANTAQNKHFRYITNKAHQDDLQFEYWSPPLRAHQIRSLHKISNSWLKLSGRREYTFVMGYFDTSYIRDCEIAVITRHGKLLAYANLIPSFGPKLRSIDHLRHLPEAPNSTTHFLIKELLLRLQDQGVTDFNLGLAPLSNIQEIEEPNLTERLLSAVKTIGSNYYSFKGLEQFKNKFEPRWQPRYIYYLPPATNLLKISVSLGSAIAMPAAGRLQSWTLRLMALVAGLTYMSFPLSYILGRNDPLLVSGLGASNQPFDWLFNSLDIIGGTMVILLAAIWLQRLTNQSRLARLMVILFGVSGLGTILAALAPLPPNSLLFGGGRPEGEHMLFTLINLVPLYLSAAIFTLQRRHNLLVAILFSGLVQAGLIAVIGLIIGSQYPDLAGTLQRIQIVVTSIWVILLGWEASLYQPDRPIDLLEVTPSPLGHQAQLQ